MGWTEPPRGLVQCATCTNTLSDLQHCARCYRCSHFMGLETEVPGDQNTCPWSCRDDCNRWCPDPHSCCYTGRPLQEVCPAGQASLHPKGQHCCPGSPQSWHGAQLTQLHSSHLESLPKPPTQPGTSRAYFCWIGGGGQTGGEGGIDSSLLTQQTMQFTWHHTVVVIITHYKYKTLHLAGLVKMGQELLREAVLLLQSCPRDDCRFPSIPEVEGSLALASSTSTAQKAFSSLLHREQRREGEEGGGVGTDRRGGVGDPHSEHTFSEHHSG